MADDNLVQSLCDETKCPICLEYFKDPVMIGCGHNFCQACISQCWGEAEETEASCPYCKNVVPSRDVKANTSLASIVEIAKRFRVQTSRATEPPGGFCNRHREPLKLFCEDDQALVCVVCDRSTQHRGHRVIPAEEAWEKYKDLLMLRLSDLRDRKQELLDSEMRFPLENLKLQELKENDIRKLFAEFKELHQFLEEEECRLQIQMKELDHTVKDMENKHIARLSKGISSVDRCIEELEEKQKQPVYDFLPDIGKTLERCCASEDGRKLE